MRGLIVVLMLVVTITGCATRPRGLTDPDANAPTSPIASSSTLQVGAGDTWEGISSRIFGDGRYAERIAGDNGLDPSVDPTPGTRLRIDVPEDAVALVRSVAAARGSYNAGVEAMQERGRDEEARDAFERALEKAPHHLDARYNLGLVLIRLGEPGRAVGHLEDVVDQRPDDVDALYGLAAAHVHRGDPRQALVPLEHALTLQPDFLRARWTHALALQRLGRTDEAAAAWQLYLDLDSTSALADEARAHLRELRPGR